MVRVREDRSVSSRACYLALGVTLDGDREVLGIWWQETEGAKFWLAVLNDLHQRGVADVLIACVDGLTGFPEAIEAVFPKAWVQTCIVHQIRSSMRWVAYGDRKKVAAELRPVYAAANVDDAEHELAAFDAKWGGRYPMIAESWRSRWDYITPFLALPADLRRIVYTTNSIENLNRHIRKAIKTRGHFPDEQAATKLIYLAIQKATPPGKPPTAGPQPSEPQDPSSEIDIPDSLPSTPTSHTEGRTALDRRHQITPGQLGQHPGVDLVGLARQRREPLDLLRIGDQHLPTVLFQRVVHEPSAGHRLDHRPHRLSSQTLSEMAQAVGIRRRSRLRDQLPGLVEQANIEPASTQIQSSVQHTNGPPRARSSMTRRACHRGGPLSSQSKAVARRAEALPLLSRRSNGAHCGSQSAASDVANVARATVRRAARTVRSRCREAWSC